MLLHSKNIIELTSNAILFALSYNKAVIDLIIGEYGVLWVFPSNIELGFTSINTVVSYPKSPYSSQNMSMTVNYMVRSIIWRPIVFNTFASHVTVESPPVSTFILVICAVKARLKSNVKIYLLHITRTVKLYAPYVSISDKVIPHNSK